MRALPSHVATRHRALGPSLLAALAFTVLAATIRLSLTPLVGRELPYLIFCAAVAASAWFGGWRAGVFAVLASAAAAQLLFVAPLFAVDVSMVAERAGLASFIVVGLTICAFAEAVHRSRARAVGAPGAPPATAAPGLANVAPVAPDGDGEAGRGFDIEQAGRTRALLASVVESSEDAIVTKGLDGIVTSWNAGAEQLFGYPAAEAIGRHITFIIPPDRHEDARRILASVGRGEKVPAFDTERLHKDGSRVPVSLSVSPLRDARGAVIGASKVARNISARIAMEAELREVAQHKDAFLATLAHELRNPLAPMRHALHLLAAGAPDPDRVGYVHGILSRQIEHLVRLVDDLLDLARINRDRLDLRRVPTRLDGIVAQAVETVRPDLDAARHLLRVELPAEPVILDVDPVRMAQVLTNLLSNAIKFTDAGGHIALEAERRDDTLVVRVSDDGIGLASGSLERVFDMFAQGHEGVENTRGGLGVGLTLVRRLVELHGGRVHIESQGRGAGATAVVTLPLGSAVADGQLPPVGVGPIPDGLARRILVVDDNRDSADTLAALLTLRGHDVSTVYDGPSALAAFAARPAHVVLLDLGMPRLSGFDVCRTLRQLPGGGTAIVVALTGWGQPQDRQRTQEAGFDAHRVKPVDVQELLALVERAPPRRAVA